jgi:membrane protease YdiL (CAAX protease family)
MQRLLSLLSLTIDPNGFESGVPVSGSPEAFWNPQAAAVCAVGLSILVAWNGFYGGFSALRLAPVRRNRLFGLMPIILLSIWLLGMMGLGLAIRYGFANAPETVQEGLMYPAIFLLDGVLIVVMLLIARRSFARRLKGFGFDPRTLGKDAGYAVVYLLAIYPLIILSLWAVLTLGQYLRDGFGIEVHQSLTFLTGETHSILRIVAILAIVVVVPVFEEVLFRGFLQTAIGSVAQSPWAAIVLTSVIFSILHPPTHIPALFFLSCALGYGYERSGSLFRPILMHILFNGFSVAASFWAV